MSKFTIDFFELMFLAEACIPPQPIARSMFWIDLCDKHYHEMSSDERKRLFDWLTPKIDLSNEDCKYFYARFDPNNQYCLKATYQGETSEINCFLHDGKYTISHNCFIADEFIDKVKKA